MRFSRWALQALLLTASHSGFLWKRKGGVSSLVVVATTDESGSASGDVPPQNAERFTFDAQVDKMLHIVVNSLYQHPEVFLRELISNASDALDKIRYLLLSEPDKYKTSPAEADIPLQVKIEYNAEQQTLTIRDTGVGMTHDEMVENLGTVARSGTTKFIQTLQESGASPDSSMGQIGQFGVGFYSTFLVADRVTVASKSPLSSTQHVWESRNGASDFLIYPDPRGNTLERGTEITLYLKDAAVEYTDPTRLKELAHHYSEFVMYPISLRVASTVEVEVDDDEDDEDDKKTDEDKKDEDETKKDEDLDIIDEEDSKPKKKKEVTTHSWEVLNTNPAIWTRDKDDVTDDEYQAFFQSMRGDDAATAVKWVHFNAEGSINFKSILYLPDKIPSDYRYGHIEVVPNSMRLYVRKVLIGNEFNLLPKYLQFITGMLDSDDLPLNVNRETLQESNLLQVIRKKLVRKVIDLISSFAKESEKDEEADKKEEVDAAVKTDKDKYLAWYKTFSSNLKIGVLDDDPNRNKLLKLLRYQTSKSNGKWISLMDYVNNMKEWQKDIYVLGGASVAELEKSPFLEAFKEKDMEVLYMTDAIDEYLIQRVRNFDGHKFVQASSDTVKFQDEDQDLIKRREKAYREKFKPLTTWLHELFRGSITRIQLATKRSLGSIPAIVTTIEHGHSANMERILMAQSQSGGYDANNIHSFKVLELNPRHPLILKLLAGAPPVKKPKKTPPKKKKDDGEDEVEVEEEEKEEPPFQLDPDILDTAWLVHDMAVLNGGFSIKDPMAHSKRLMKTLQNKLGLESLDLEPEIDPPVLAEDFNTGETMDRLKEMGYDPDKIKVMDLDENMNMDEVNMDEL